MRWSVTRTGGGGSRSTARLLLTGAMTLALAACGASSSVEVAPIPVPSVSSAPATGLDVFYGQEVTWKNCGDADCTTVKVPLDYANPGGSTLKLAVTRGRIKPTSWYDSLASCSASCTFLTTSGGGAAEPESGESES